MHIDNVPRAVPIDIYVALDEYGTSDVMVDPTIASSDFKISKSGGIHNNLGTLPVVTPSGTRQLKIALSETEMDDVWLRIQGVDQTSPKQWEDVEITIRMRDNPTGKVLVEAGNTSSTFKVTLFGMGTEATDYTKNAYWVWLTGALKGQVQKISAYDSTTDFITVATAFTAAPATDDRGEIVNR